MLWMLFLFVVTLGILIAFHEFGHYSIARLCGVHVERFSLGFGPKIASFRTRSGTEFQLAAIPLGGYVKMLDGRVDKLTPQNTSVAFDRQSVSKRAAIIAAGPIANFILAFLLYWIIFQLGVVSFPVKVAETVPNSIAASLNIVPDSELKSIDGIKVEDWQDVRLALVGSLGKRAIVITYSTPGQTQEIQRTAYLKRWKMDLEKEDPIATFGFIPKKPEILPILSAVMLNSAAERAGLQVGDRIINVDGAPLTDWIMFANQIKAGHPHDLEIERQGKRMTVHLVPEIQHKANNVVQGFAGITPQTTLVTKTYAFFPAFVKSLGQTGFMIKLTMRSFYQLVTGTLSLNNLSGPVTIAKSADQSASYGIVAYLYFLAFISISLGVVNLLPLPILDGGHLVFLVIEKVMGRPVSEQKVTWIYKLSFILLIMLMGIALFNDFSRLSF